MWNVFVKTMQIAGEHYLVVFVWLSRDESFAMVYSWISLFVRDLHKLIRKWKFHMKGRCSDICRVFL